MSAPERITLSCKKEFKIGGDEFTFSGTSKATFPRTSYTRTDIHKSALAGKDKEITEQGNRIKELEAALEEAAYEIEMYADFRGRRLSHGERFLGGVDGLTPRTTPESEKYRAIAKGEKK